MAAGRLLIPGWARALDSDGEPISARISLFLTGTDALASVYSDEGLTVPLQNPVLSNSAGRFPAIWASDAITYDWSVEAPYGPPGSPFTGTGLTIALAADVLAADAAEAAADAAALSETNAAASEATSQAILDDINNIILTSSTVAGLAGRLLLNGSNVAGNAATLRANIGAVGSAALAASGGATAVGTQQSALSGTVARTANAKLNDIFDARDWGANPSSGVDQTAIVQAAVTALAAVPDAVLNVPRGVKCSYRDISFATNHRIEIRYIRSDELNQSGYVTLNTGETANLVVKSGFPTDASGGYVAEDGIEAPLHATLVADSRPEMLGVSSGLGPGQSLLEPVRVSWSQRQSLRDRYAVTTISYTEAISGFSGVYHRSYYQEYVLGGVGSTAWGTPPVVGDKVTTSGGGRGFVTAIAPGNMTVVWTGGTFVVGQTMGDSNESGKGPISSVALSIKEMSPLVQSLASGKWGIDLPPGSLRAVLDIGGDIGVQPTQTFGQRTQDIVVSPGFAWRKTLGASTGASVRQIATENEKRLWVYDGPTESASPRGLVGAVCASVAFASTALTTKAINVSGITNPVTGRYNVAFTRSLANAEYSVNVSASSLMTRPAGGATFYTVGYEFVDPSSIAVYISVVDLVANTVTAANIPAGAQVTVTVIGGDI